MVIASFVQCRQMSRIQAIRNETCSESGFIRDAALFTAERILQGSSRDRVLRKRAHEIKSVAGDIELKLVRLRRELLTLRPDREPKRRKH